MSQEVTSNQTEGTTRLKRIAKLQKETLSSTSAPGQEMLRRDNDTLQADWETFVTNGNDIRLTLQRALAAWHEFEDSHNALGQWLRTKEQQLKEYELKATLEEKTEQVDKFKVRKDLSQLDLLVLRGVSICGLSNPYGWWE